MKLYIAKQTVTKIAEFNIEVLPYPPYFPDSISPIDYHLSKHLDAFLMGKNFNKEKSVKNAFKKFIDARSPDFFWKDIDALGSPWQKRR